MTGVALVVGGATAAGRTAALGLARGGFSVVAAGPPEDSGAALARAILRDGGVALACDIDPATDRGAREAVDQAVRTFGGLDVLVLSAAPEEERSVLKLEAETWERALRSGVTAAFACCRAAAARMLEARRPGRIVCLMGSEGLRAPRFGRVHWATVNGALWGLVRSLAAELRHKDVTVNAVAVNSGSSPVLDGEPEAGSPELEALPDLVSFLISPAAAEVTGQVVCLEGERLALLRTLDTVGALAPRGGWTPDEIARRWPDLCR